MTLDTTLEPQEAPMSSYALKNGTIIALVGIAISLVIYFTGNIAQSWAAWVGLPLIIFLYYFFQKKFRDEHQGGYISLGKAFKLGAIMVLVGAIFNAVYSYLIFSDPEVMDQIMEKTYNDMIDGGQTASQAEQAMEMASAFMTPGAMMAFGLIGGIIIGLIIVLITGAIVKREPAFN